MYRHLALYRRSWPRLLELTYWPTLQLCIWGFTASYFAARLGSSGAVTIGLLLGAVLLWEIALRSQMGVAVGFLRKSGVAQPWPRVRQPAAAARTGGCPDRHLDLRTRRRNSGSPARLGAVCLQHPQPRAGAVPVRDQT